MTDTTTPRCPSCGAAMHIYLFAENTLWCDICRKTMDEPPARVPCPACEGEGTLTLRYPCGEWVDEVVYPCTLCHNSGDVPSALAAAWRADEEG